MMVLGWISIVVKRDALIMIALTLQHHPYASHFLKTCTWTDMLEIVYFKKIQASLKEQKIL